MDDEFHAPKRLSDAELLAEVKRLTACECQATARLVASLAELDARRLYVGVGCASLFTYCTEVLGLSEGAAYFRIEAARASRRFPLILERLGEGAITLSTVRLLAPHLTTENHRELLDQARGRSKRAVEELVAREHARPDVPSSVRKLPSAKVVVSTCAIDFAAQCADGNETASIGHSDVLLSPSANGNVPREARIAAQGARPVENGVGIASNRAPARAVVSALAPERYKVQMTVSAETHAKLRRAQDLLRHVIPDGDPAAVFDRALTVLIDRLEHQKCGAKSASGRRGARSDRGCVAGSQQSIVAELAPGKVPGGRGRCALHVAGRGQRRAHQPPTARSRYISPAVRREVWARDSGRCTFVGAEGRCTETGLLEFHHIVPHAAGGEATTENLRLMCRCHNGHEADMFFGP